MASIRPGDDRHTLFPTSIKAGPWHYKTLAEAIAEICQITGWEFRVEPREPSLETTYWTGSSYVSPPANVPIIGLSGCFPVPDRPVEGDPLPVVFEYGTTRANVASYSFTTDREAQANQIFVPRPNFPQPGYSGPGAANVTDSAASAAFGRLQAHVDPNGIEISADRTALANSHLALRKGPRRRITFQPTRNNIMQPFVDYNPGDWVRFRALDHDVLRLDVFVRIYNIAATLDDAGNESVELTTVEE